MSYFLKKTNTKKGIYYQVYEGYIIKFTKESIIRKRDIQHRNQYKS